MARPYAGYKRVSIRVRPSSLTNKFRVELLSGNGTHLMKTLAPNGHDKDTANAIARRLGDSFRPACTVRTTLAE